jgi:alkanesulfonate monooxygenase SsuD/methylene tetrahydromethanopterin reductase-like flavin-dependent oxidoreductase (luciferase family)
MFSGDAARVLAFARRAEERGFDGVFAFDHLFPPGASPDRQSLEAYATLSAVAAGTTRIAVGTLVTRATLRSAGMLAKLAAAVDDVSGGRMILGIGTGDPIDELEHRVFGIEYLGRRNVASTSSRPCAPSSPCTAGSGGTAARTLPR